MGRPLFSGNGYALYDGAADGNRAASADTDIAATTGFTESVSLDGAANYRVTVDSTAGSTGNWKVKTSPDKAFAQGVITQHTGTIPAGEDGADFSDAGPFTGFVRVYNETNAALKAYIQIWVDA